MYTDLSEKFAVVTGASRGIGRCIAEECLNYGATLYAIARASDDLSSLGRQAKKRGQKIITLETDLKDVQQIEDLSHSIENVDILIHNAAFFQSALIQDMSIENWEEHIRLNLTAPFLLTRVLWDRLKKCPSKEASIVFISSLGGVIHKEKFPGTSAYVATKMGLVGFCEALASEGRPFGIRVNCVSPGSVDTEMLRKTFPDMKADFTVKNISNMVLYMASSISKPISGSNIIVQV